MELMAGATDGILSPSDVMEQECWGSGLQPSSRQDLPAALSSNHCASQQALFPRLPSPFLSSLIPCFILLPMKFVLLCAPCAAERLHGGKAQEVCMHLKAHRQAESRGQILLTASRTLCLSLLDAAGRGGLFPLQ